MAKAVRWDLYADPRKFNKGFRDAERTSDRLGKTIKRTASLIGGAFAAVQVAGFLKGAIDEAREAQKVGRQTAAVIKATGGVAKVSARDVDRLSDSLSRKVGVDDEIIAAGANMLLTFKGVRNEVGKGNDVFTQASSVILDMTAAMHQGEVTQQGLEKATIQVGKALNDPIKGITALTRVGVTFTQGQKDQIKALVEAGRAQDAQRIILKELRSEFGGAAAAAADSGKRLAVVWANIKERIGKLLLPALDSAAGVITGKLIPAAERFWKIHGPGFRDALGDAASKVGAFVSELGKNLGPELARVGQVWEANRQSITGFITQLTSADTSMASSERHAKSLATAFGDIGVEVVKTGGGLTKSLSGLDQEFRKFTSSSQASFEELGEGMAKRDPLFQRLRNWLIEIDGGLEEVSTSTDRATTATERHKQILEAQRRAADNAKTALEELRRATDDEAYSEVNLRQAKLNVSTAQKRLTELRREGKTGTDQYKQAQIDLTRAKIDLREKTRLYRDSLEALRSKTESSKLAQQEAARASRKAGEDNREAGRKARNAAVDWTKLRDGISGALDAMRSKKAFYTASFSIHTPPGISVHDIVGAKGGLVTPAGIIRRAAGGIIDRGSGPTADDVLARLSRGEFVVNAKATAANRALLETINRSGLPGFAAGGRVGGMQPSFRMAGEGTLLAALRGFPGLLDRGLRRLGDRFETWAKKQSVGKPGILAFIRSTDPLPYVWGAAGPGAYDCSGLVSAVYGKHTGRGGGAGQRYFTTASISATGGLKPGLGGILNIGVTPGQGHMSGSYAGLRFEARSTRSGILVGGGARDPASFARHFHMAKGGLVDRQLVELFARLAGADIGGDAGRLRINGKAFDRGGRIPEDVFGMGRSGRTYSFHGGETVNPRGALDPDVLADALVRALERYGLRVGVDDVHTALLAKKRRQGRVALGLD